MPAVRFPANGLVWVPGDSLEYMRFEAARTHPLETGGVLIGYWVSRGRELVVTGAFGPGRNAMHAAHRFEPDSAYHQQVVSEAYESSGRLHVYVGDWHTHPTRSAALSPLDRRTLRSIARAPSARMPVPVMSVLGQAAEDEREAGWHLAVWRFVPVRERLRSAAHISQMRFEQRLVWTLSSTMFMHVRLY